LGFRLGYFLKVLNSNLDKAFNPPNVPAPVARNQDPEAIRMCCSQIKSMFNPLEFVWISNNTRHRGWCRNAKYWLEDIEKNGVPTSPEGAFVKINPLSRFGTGNSEVKSYRHCLCEADSMGIEEQMELAGKLKFPIVSAVFSGSRSIHYVLKVDCSMDEYAPLVQELHKQFPQFDSACKDPARWTRLAGAMRGDKLQKALPLNFAKIITKNPVAGEGMPAESLAFTKTSMQATASQT